MKLQPHRTGIKIARFLLETGVLRKKGLHSVNASGQESTWLMKGCQMGRVKRLFEGISHMTSADY